MLYKSYASLVLNLLCWGSMYVFLFYAHTSGGALSSGSSSSSLWVVSLVQNILIGVSTKKWGCHCYNTEPNVCIRQIDTTKKSYELFSSSFKVLLTLQFIFNFWLVKKSKMQYLLLKLLKKTTSNNWIWNNYVQCN